jgi:hypothetical protein
MEDLLTVAEHFVHCLHPSSTGYIAKESRWWNPVDGLIGCHFDSQMPTGGVPVFGPWKPVAPFFRTVLCETP